MSYTPSLQTAISDWDQSTGESVDPSAPWTDPNWDKPNNDQSADHAQFNDWFQQQYGYMPDYGKSASATTTPQNINPSTGQAYNPQTGQSYTGTGTASTQQQLSPAYLSQMFAGGVPQVNPATVGNIPNVTPQQIDPNSTGYSAAQASTSPMQTSWGYNPTQASSGPSTDQIVQSITNANSGLFAQQDRGLQEQLGALGIYGGTTSGALADLGTQQQTQQNAQVAPYIMQGYQMNQTSDLANQAADNSAAALGLNLNYGAAGANQQNAQTTALANQNATNTAAQFGAGQQLTAQQLNQATDLSAQTQNQNTNANAQQYNASSTNAANVQNAQWLMQTGQIDAATYNNMITQLYGYQNQDWLAQLGANTSIQQGAQQGQTGGYTPNYTQPGQSNLGNLGSSLGSTITAAWPAPTSTKSIGPQP